MAVSRNVLMLCGTLACLLALAATAADQDRDQLQLQDQTGDADQLRDRDRLQDQDPDQLRVHQDEIYGGQLMSEQERRDYSVKMSGLGTEAEREQFQVEHRARMQERAKKLGVTLPGEADPQMHEEQMRLRPQAPSLPQMPGAGGGGRGR